MIFDGRAERDALDLSISPLTNAMVVQNYLEITDCVESESRSLRTKFLQPYDANRITRILIPSRLLFDIVAVTRHRDGGDVSMRVLIVEDNETFASLMSKRLDRSGIESDLARTVDEAERAIASVEYAAIVLDLGLGDRDGLDLLRGLRTRGNSIPVVITSARHSLEDRVRGLREGADDYLAKPFSIDELIARLQAVMRRPGRFVGQTLRLGNLALETESRQITINGILYFIRVRETMILELLLRHAGQVVQRHFFEAQLFGRDGEQDSNTVDVYVHRLRRQLLDAGATVMIHTIRGVGYMLTEYTHEQCNGAKPPLGARS